MGGRFRKRPFFTLVVTSKHLLFSVRSRGGVGHKMQSSTTPQFRKYSKKRCPLLARVSVLMLGGAVQQVRWSSALPSSGSRRHGQHVLLATGLGLVWCWAAQPWLPAVPAPGWGISSPCCARLGLQVTPMNLSFQSTSHGAKYWTSWLNYNGFVTGMFQDWRLHWNLLDGLCFR